MKLYGEFLKDPKLRFDYSSNYAVETLSKRGLLRHGPYDSNLFGKNKITCTLISPGDAQREKQIFIDGLAKGEGTFKGFKEYFKVPLEFTTTKAFGQNISILLDQIPSENPDILYALLNKKHSDLYGQIKSKLLANGIPSQMMTIENINNTRGRPYILENISLASYAKVGGTPWTVSTTTNENNLIIGISRTQDYSKKYLVGFVTIFSNDGDFLFMHSKAPVVSWENYVQGLGGLITSAIEEYENERGTPHSIIVHFHKNPGRKEIEAIENALKTTTKNIPYAIIHLNEYSNSRLFDSNHYTYIPLKGLKVRLSVHEALLLLDGRIGDSRYRVGVPRILSIRMDKRSTVDTARFSEFVQQIYDFAHINWRGFNSAAIPITLNYSKLIARTVIEIGIQNWNQIIAGGRLRDKAWFL